jgi:hypothetical protein
MMTMAETRTDDRGTVKMSREVKRIWDMIAAARQETRDACLKAVGQAVLADMRKKGELP